MFEKFDNNIELENDTENINKNKDKSEFLEFDYENPEKFIEDNFKKTEREVEKEGLKYKMIEFQPKSEEVKKFVIDSQFYLFGGNGQAGNRNYHGSKETAEAYEKWWVEDNQKINDMLENNFDKLLKKTEESMIMIEGLIKSIGKESLAGYYSSALCGEGNALYAKEMMENGENMEEKTIEHLNKKEGLCFSSQLSTYTPYISTLFIRKDMGEMEEYKNIFDEAYKDLKELNGKKDNKIIFDNLITDEKKVKSLMKYDNLPVDKRRRLHELIYSKMYNLERAILETWDDLFNKKTFEYIESNRYKDAFSLMKFKEKNLFNGQAGFGWDLPAISELKNVTDFAMVTGKEFYEDGVVRFMVIEH